MLFQKSVALLSFSIMFSIQTCMINRKVFNHVMKQIPSNIKSLYDALLTKKRSLKYTIFIIEG